MINQEFILLIMNCQKYRWKADVQKNGWLKSLPADLIYFHVLGDESLATDYLFDDEVRVLWVKTPDDYVSLPKKVITAYKAIFKTYNYKYVFKTDDDQELQNRNFFEVIKKLISCKEDAPHYGGFVVNVTRPHVSKYYLLHSELPTNLIIQKTKYCSGRFYFLSSSAIQNLLSKKDIISSEYLEDYAVGYYLDDEFKRNLLPIDTNKYFKDLV
jgi:hypothetical protein